MSEMNRRDFCKRIFGLAVTMIIPTTTFTKMAPHISGAERVFGIQSTFRNATVYFTLDEIDPETLKLAMGEPVKGKLNFI